MTNYSASMMYLDFCKYLEKVERPVTAVIPHSPLLYPPSTHSIFSRPQRYIPEMLELHEDIREAIDTSLLQVSSPSLVGGLEL